ncbi:MAG: hypothetical protein WCV52_02200, partial [Candidatus Paceibacterota bacterium]
MKKYILFLFVLVFVFGLFIFNNKPVNALVGGCSSTSGFSTTTGVSCSMTPPASTCVNGINPTTGFRCGCS